LLRIAVAFLAAVDEQRSHMPLEKVDGVVGHRGVANGERREARKEDAKTLRHTVALAQVREPSGRPSEPPDNQNPEVSTESIAFWQVGLNTNSSVGGRPRPYGRSA
jgi:hypothetical protein